MDSIVYKCPLQYRVLHEIEFLNLENIDKSKKISTSRILTTRARKLQQKKTITTQNSMIARPAKELQYGHLFCEEKKEKKTYCGLRKTYFPLLVS